MIELTERVVGKAIPVRACDEMERVSDSEGGRGRLEGGDTG